MPGATHFARQHVGVDDGHAQRREQVGDRGFAAGDAAGQPDAEAARMLTEPATRTAKIALDDLVADQQAQPAGGREERAEGDLGVQCPCAAG